MKKILTVTIPAYNVAQYLNETIPSFLDERIIDDIEVLIINDGSSDWTLEIALQYQEKYEGTVVVVNKENGGHGSTINKGIEIASGEYFKVVDGDDWVDTQEFVNYVYALKNINADVILTPYNRVNTDTHQVEKRMIRKMEEGKVYQFDKISSSISEIYQMHSITFRTQVLKGIRAIDEHCFYVDQEYILLPLKNIKTIIYENYNIYQYRVGNNEQSVSIKNMQKNREMHNRVIRTLINYWQNEELYGSKEEFLKSRIAGLCARQIEIYFSMDVNKSTYKELKKFMSEIKKQCKDIYSDIPGKKMFALKASNCLLYYFIANLYKLR